MHNPYIARVTKIATSPALAAYGIKAGNALTAFAATAFAATAFAATALLARMAGPAVVGN